MAKPQSFKPGDPRINRNGRPPKEWTWSGLLKEALEETVSSDDPRQYKKLVAEALRLKAVEGDVQAIKEFGNRIDGLPLQNVDVKSDGEKLEAPMIVIDTHGKD